MNVFPPAKINIGLYITEKRNDGFHNIETIFYPVPLTDILEIDITDGPVKLQFESGGIVLPDVTDNLCCKAYHLLDKIFDLPPVKIRLVKRIPFGAGLGGGSSDAAYTLQVINEICHLGLSAAELSGYASKLGSDCAFFLMDGPAIGSGRGEILQPLPLQISQYILLVKPPVFVGTADAYASVVPMKPEQHLPDLVRLPVSVWKDNIINDFEKSVFRKYPVIERIKQEMYQAGAVYASMSGSGSSVYGFFDRIPDHPDRLFPDCFVWHNQNDCIVN